MPMKPSSSKQKYKTPSFQKMYDAMLAAAKDPASELYYHGRPHRGAGHRVAFFGMDMSGCLRR